MSLERISWIITVCALITGAAIGFIAGYQGYAALALAVAAAAAINLT